MTRALVLGGGGPVGIGWEAGLLIGMMANGIDLAAADAFVGTSAGSVVAFTLASGRDLSEATTLVEASVAAAGNGGQPADEGDAEIGRLLAAVAEAAVDPAGGDAARARLGQLALDSPTISEEQWLNMFAAFAGAAWPDRFACTAVDTATGRFQLWEASSGVDVQHAVASSCAVPCVFPPVTIRGARWMDGGVKDMINADAAAGHDTVLAVSCTLLELPEGLSIPGLDAVLAATQGRLNRLRGDGSKVETIVPGAEMLDISAWGMNLMDYTRVGDAYQAGVRQGAVEANRLAGFWEA